MMQMPVIGAQEPWTPLAPLFHPPEDGASPLWFALRCAPLREEAAVYWLKERGVTSFFPVTRRQVTVRGKPQERVSLFLPGYVFGKFPAQPVWHRVLDRDNPARRIIDVLRLASGTPGRLKEGDLARLRAIANEDADERAAREEAERVRSTVQVGSLVRFPLIPGVDGEVVALTGKGGIRVKFTLLGAERVVTAEGGFEVVIPVGQDS